MTVKAYKSPLEGQIDRGGNYTNWVQMPDGKWCSPKDISGLPRNRITPIHIAQLMGKFIQLKKLPRVSQRGRKRNRPSAHRSNVQQRSTGIFG